MEDMDSIKDKVMEVKEKWGFKEEQPKYSMPATSSRPLPSRKTTMVGFDDELKRLMDVLTRQEPKRQIISVIGMGGTGKTTLARNVYENSLIMRHFDIRAWTTISQEYSLREILLQLLSCEKESTSETDDELGEKLRKRLSGRRYLIILDDVWSSKVWDEIKFLFPDDGNKSRIVITTRLSDMDSHFNSSSFVMKFLDEDKSWKLFCEKALGVEDYRCPSELEEIGKKIVEKCAGLPLSIVVIGGHLGKSSRTKENWETVAKNIKPILNSREGEECLSILSLSYSYLPAYLKPCFLYMGIFPEDREIDVSELIKLWVAEGFLKPNKDQSLEEVAMGCLNDLVDRNLILVRQWSENGKIIESCNMHDLLRVLCLKVAEKEKFLCVLNLLDHTSEPINRERRIAIHGYHDNDKYHGILNALKSAPLVRSLMGAPARLSLDCKLLKIRTFDFYSPSSPDVTWVEAQFQRLNLRYLDLFYHNRQSPCIHLPSSISLLWNLQTLIIHGIPKSVVAPSEIWEMPQLRHVVAGNGFHLPDPPSSDRLDQQDNLQDNFVLSNLQTLFDVENFRLSEEVCKRIPNIKRLGISYNSDSEVFSSSEYCLHYLGHFHKLESLDCGFFDIENFHALDLTFPMSLKELRLSAPLEWEDLTMIGSLPHLEVLELSGADVMGPEWNPVEGEFRRLKFLGIHLCGYLETWNADRSHFPVLETLSISYAHNMGEIPSGIGEIPTLQRITLTRCSESAAISAMRILVEQEELGNPGLLLEIRGRTGDLERFREIVKEEGLSSKNLRFHNWDDY